MLAQATNLFGLTVAELAILALAVGYVISLCRDWRPIRTLRRENADLRGELEKANVKIHDLEVELAVLSQATDLTVLQQEHRQIAETLTQVALKLESLDGSVKANTAAVELFVKGSVIADAIAGQSTKDPL